VLSGSRKKKMNISTNVQKYTMFGTGMILSEAIHRQTI
jgi:hypothetical protein